VVLIPYTTALKMYPAFRRNVVVAAQAVSAEAVPEAKAQITNLLRRRHGLEAHQPNDFIVQTQGRDPGRVQQRGQPSPYRCWPASSESHCWSAASAS
jgi:hypothetical protein